MANARDNFNRASLGTNWTLGLSTVAISGSVDVIGTGTDSSAWWNANTFGGDHWSQITRKDSNDGAGAIVRHQSGANTFYAWTANVGTGGVMWEVTAGSFAQLGAGYGGLVTSAGHTIKLDATGSTLTPSIDGVATATRSDASITGGKPGVHCSGTTSHADDWIGGPISGVTTVFLVSGTSYTSPSDWDNANNTIETIGGGGPGDDFTSGHGTGGGGGAWNKIANFTFATPGTTTATYQVGAGGIWAGGGNTAATDTWFNGANLAASSVGSKAGATGVAGAGSQNGGAGGVGSSGVGTWNASGGRGGNLTGASGAGGSGGGGAGGLGNDGLGTSGTGSNAVDDATTGANVQTAGGQGDGTFGGAGGAAAAPAAGAGGAGKEWDATHGSGGGGGGSSASGGNNTGGAGGLYGGGGGGARSTGGGGNSPAGGNGAQGIITLIYTPAVAVVATGRMLLVFP